MEGRNLFESYTLLGQRFITEFKIAGPNMPPLFGIHKFDQFRAMWNRITSDSKQLMRPVMWPKMVYSGTFGFSQRALRHFGVEHITAPHPSARIGSFDDKAEQIATAIRSAA